MGLEVATYISELVDSNPVGGVDDYATADDHLRLIKLVLQSQFPNFNAAAVNATPAELNILDGVTAVAADLNIVAGADAAGLTAAELLFVNGVTSNIQTQLNGKAATSHTHAASDVTSGTFDDARVQQTNVTQHEAAINHDNLLGFVGNEHIDWTVGQGATNIHVDNVEDVPESAVTDHVAALNHNSLLNYVANRHIDHSAVSTIAGEGLSGGGDHTASRTVNMDVNSLTELEIDAIDDDDAFLVYDDGAATHRKMLYSKGGIHVNPVIATTKTFAEGDLNQIHQLTGGTDRLWSINTGLGRVGNFLIFVQRSTGSVEVGGSATILNSIGDFTRTTNSVIVLYQIDTDTWVLGGDAAAS